MTVDVPGGLWPSQSRHTPSCTSQSWAFPSKEAEFVVAVLTSTPWAAADLAWGHSGHVENFPSALKSHRTSPVSRPGKLVRASGMNSMKRSTFPIFQLSFQKPHGYVRKKSLDSSTGVPAAPCRAPRPSGQRGRISGWNWDAVPSAVSTARGWAPCRALAPPPSTAPAHVLRDSFCPSAGLTLHPCRNPNRFLSKSNSLEHREPAAPLLRVQLCKGVTGRDET